MGVLLVAALGGARPVIKSRTVTVPAATGAGGTVVVSTRVPPLTGQRLDVTLDRLERARSRRRSKVADCSASRGGQPARRRPVADGRHMLEQGSQVALRVARN